MRRRHGAGGFSLLEVAFMGAVMALVVALAFGRWQGHIARQRLRYGTAQVAINLRQAQERAKAERILYTVAFAASSQTYSITRSGGGFLENARLPDGVTASATVTVTFSAFGRPDAAYTITIQNSAGTASAMVNATGGISYQEP